MKKSPALLSRFVRDCTTIPFVKPFFAFPIMFGPYQCFFCNYPTERLYLTKTCTDICSRLPKCGPCKWDSCQAYASPTLPRVIRQLLRSHIWDRHGACAGDFYPENRGFVESWLGCSAWISWKGTVQLIVFNFIKGSPFKRLSCWI